MSPYDVRLTMFRLIELEDSRKEDMAAASGPDSPFWEMAEDREEAIRAKLDAQPISRPGWGEAWYPSPPQLGLPPYDFSDAERVYLTQAERKEIILRGSEYLRRHPEMLSDCEFREDECKWRQTCPVHLCPEPCPTCQSYIAAGL